MGAYAVSHSFWKLADAFWVCFVFIVVGSTQVSPIDAGVQVQNATNGESRAYSPSRSHLAAGRLTVDAVALFDVNNMHAGVFGDSEAVPSPETKMSR